MDTFDRNIVVWVLLKKSWVRIIKKSKEISHEWNIWRAMLGNNRINLVGLQNDILLLIFNWEF